MEPDSTVDNRVQELDIAEGLKQLLLDAGFTVESVTPKQLGLEPKKTIKDIIEDLIHYHLVPEHRKNVL